MKQPNLKQLESLKQVLKLYQQQLILVQTSFEQQTTVVDRIRQNGILLIDELDDAQNSASRPTANGLELANHLMKSIQSKLSQNEIELNAARLERESIRAELKKLVSKKEALEKTDCRTNSVIESSATNQGTTQRRRTLLEHSN